MRRESDVFPTTLVGFSTDFAAALFLHNYLEPSGGNKWTNGPPGDQRVTPHEKLQQTL
ncbi:hypothetical protein N9H90_10755 [Pseudomonadales bacterium]|nr:hypothetical protein [Pseudomonadales bacterium]